MGEPAFEAATVLVEKLRRGEIGSEELLEHFIDRIERYDGALNAIVVRDFERARSRAREADAARMRGEDWGPLHGLPMPVKESFTVAGLPTTWGQPALKDNIAETDALAVERLKAAGAVIMGKTNVPLNLADLQSYNQVYGSTDNPHASGRTPGGSSGGAAAALAAGLTGLEMGSDIGGSIRNPAHFCGVYGLKPTWGILPPRGHALPGVLSPSDISVIGPLARSAADLRLALDICGGADRLQNPGWTLDLPEPRQARLGDFRVAAWLDSDRLPIEGSVRALLQAAVDAVAEAGARVDPEARPDLDPDESHRIYLTLLQGVLAARRPQADLERVRERVGTLDPEDLSDPAVSVRAMVQSHGEWLVANERRTHLRWAWRRFFDSHDLLLCPIIPVGAFPRDESEDLEARRIRINGESVRYFDQIFWAGLTGVALLPSVIAPVGRTPDGLPVGLQIVAPEMGEKLAIRFAELLAEAIGGFRPPEGYG